MSRINIFLINAMNMVEINRIYDKKTNFITSHNSHYFLINVVSIVEINRIYYKKNNSITSQFSQFRFSYVFTFNAMNPM